MIIEEKKNCKKGLPSRNPENRKRTCLSCGTDNMKKGRRYCSKECRQRLLWVLSLSKGLLQTLNIRYAAFSFSESHVSLDVIPTWANELSRFVYRRKPGHTPALTLKELVLEAGKEWYIKRNNRISQSLASQSILEEKIEHGMNPNSIKPNSNKIPKLSAKQKNSLKDLNITLDNLTTIKCSEREIKKAYWKMAKIYHPDIGGDNDRFKEVNSAYETIMEWIKNPKFQFSNGLPGCWFYDGYNNRWSPPMRK